ncbi:MAG: hypothetical protein ACR2NL_09580 [Acidimicrobiia bacterium]
MSQSFPELQVLRISVDPATRERHLDAIHSQLRKAARPRRRRRLLSLALAVVLLVPVVALAAEQSLPGDFLYPVKKAVVEPVISIFDSDVTAENRVPELERMLDSDVRADILRGHVRVARDAASDLPDLVHRIDRVEMEVDRRLGDSAPVRSNPPASETTDSTAVDRVVPTTDPVVDTSSAGDRPPPGDGGRGG